MPYEYLVTNSKTKTDLDKEVQDIINSYEIEGKKGKITGTLISALILPYKTPKGEVGVRIHFKTEIDGKTYIKLISYGSEMRNYDWILAKDI